MENTENKVSKVSNLETFFKVVSSVEGLTFEQREVLIQAGYILSRDEWREGFNTGFK